LRKEGMGRKKLKGKQLSEDTKQKRWATHYGMSMEAMENLLVSNVQAKNLIMKWWKHWLENKDVVREKWKKMKT
jgi:hypothetical protein